ncbi:MAG: putative molybdenum carrier protein [Kiritimatiellae bacterium]|nr:putative molybdenum carrier protein [Kiritimatiellia bacterium]
MQKNEIKIVSGGQTGVDRGGLQAAMDMGLAWGGWAPKGWRSEDGTIPPLYRANMQEHASANYLGRTRRNVVDSHATLIVTNTYPLSGGTLKTRFFCEETMRSHFVVSLGEPDAVGKVQRWLAQFFAIEHPVPFVLNVAGPRESKAVGIQERTRHFLTEVLQGMLENAGPN